MAYDQGIDFRSTSGFVTDPANCDAETGTTANYPRTSAQGNTVGWEDAPAGTRNRTSSVDARLAGIAFANNGTAKRYRFDLPSSGWYRITLALGDNTTGQSLNAEVLDTTTAVSNVIRQNVTVSAGTFFDACGVRRSSASDWVTNEVSFVAFFSTTTCRIRLGTSTVASGSSPIAHARVTDATAPADPLPAGVDFRLTTEFVTDPSDSSPYINTVADYPHITTQGLTVGWEQAPSGQADRSSGIDARLAGIHNVTNSGVSKFRIDLPYTGDFDISVALGDATTAQTQTAELFDSTTSLGVIVAGGATTTAQWYDASGVKRTTAIDWVSNEVEARRSLTTTILRIAVGANGATAGNSTISHLHIRKAPLVIETGFGDVGTFGAGTSFRFASSSKAGHGVANAKGSGSGVKVSQSAKTGYGLAGTSGSGSRSTTAVEVGFADVAAKGSGSSDFIPGGVHEKSGWADAHPFAAGTDTAEWQVIAPIGALTLEGDPPTVYPIYASLAQLILDGDAPTTTTTSPIPSGIVFLKADPPALPALYQPETGVITLRGDAPRLVTSLPPISGSITLQADAPTVYPTQTPTATILLQADGPGGNPTTNIPGRLLLRGDQQTIYPMLVPSGVISLKADAPEVTTFQVKAPSGIILLKAGAPIVTPLNEPPPPPPPPPGAGMAVSGNV